MTRTPRLAHLLVLGALLTACRPTPAVPTVLRQMGMPAVLHLGEAGPVTVQAVQSPTGTPSPAPTPSAATSIVPSPAASAPRSRGGGGSRGGGAPVPTPTPVPPGVVSNTLSPGTGAIAGLVLDVIHGGQPVGGATLTVTDTADRTRQAILINEADGTYSLTGLAPGVYEVAATRLGYTSASAPVVVTLYPSALAVTTANMVLVAP